MAISRRPSLVYIMTDVFLSITPIDLNIKLDRALSELRWPSG